VTELAHPHRHGDRRFVRHARAVTQAEIRRLSRLGVAPAQQPHDAVETVQHELRRLSGPEAAAAESPRRR